MNKKLFSFLCSLVVIAMEMSVVASSQNPGFGSLISINVEEDFSDEEIINDDENNLHELFGAVCTSDIHDLTCYLFINPTHIQSKDSDNASILHLLALQDDNIFSYEQQKERIAVLVSFGANINSKDFSGDTPLHKAAMNGHFNALQALIDSGADVNIQNYDGGRPINTINILATEINEVNCMQALISAGAVLHN